MNYKYITGQVLEIDPSSGWTDGTLLQDIYPDSSFVSGNNTDSMQMKPEIKNRKVYAKYSFAKRFEGGPGLVHGGILSAALDDMMGYSTVIHNIFSVTANLSVNFLLRPAIVYNNSKLDIIHLNRYIFIINNKEGKT